MKKLRMAIILALIAIGSGCACNPVIVPPTALPLPDRPILPRITADEIRSIPDEAVRLKVIDRDQLRKKYAEELEAIIKSTHKKAP